MGSRLRAAAPWIAGAVVLAALVAAGVFIAVMSRSAAPESGPKQTTITPAQETSSAAETSPATTPVNPGVEATPAPGGAATPTPDADRAPVRARLIAFRLSSTVYSAAEDGGNRTPIARIPEGSYALSPDGSALAAVYGGQLLLVDTATRKRATVSGAFQSGALMGECPVWSPDSRVVYFVKRSGAGEETAVWRVARDGSGEQRMSDGACPSVSPDGRVVAAVDTDGSLWVRTSGGRFQRVSVSGGRAASVAAANERLYVGVVAADGSTWLVTMRPDGAGSRILAGGPAQAPRAMWGVLRLSPDGRWLAAAATGDDKYSRVTIVNLENGTLTPLESRRDLYVKYWSASGGHLYCVEGNAYQGEPTVLLRFDPDGGGKKALVTGAQ